jgi:hypothetical protein
MHVYEVIPRKDHRGVAAISDALPFIIALIVGDVFVLTVIAAAVIVNWSHPSRSDARLRNQTAQR